jgi:hypothetical protein
MLHTARPTTVYLLVPTLFLLSMAMPVRRSDAKGNDVALGFGLESCQSFLQWLSSRSYGILMACIHAAPWVRVHGCCIFLSWSAILTNSAKDCTCILCMTRNRWTLTVYSITPSAAAICLLSCPATTRPITSHSRGVSRAYRACRGATTAR